MTKYFTILMCIVLFSCGLDKDKEPKFSDDKTISISNTEPRLDDEGQIVDAHDGRIIQFEDTYYWYGTAYGNTNGFTTKNYYQCYSSKDLKTWKKEGRLLPDQATGTYYRPHVIYNEKTENYVLWYNWYPQLWDGQFGVAVSDTPQGPFEIINDNVPMKRSEVGLGDFGLFVDDDQTAYISYNTIQNHQVSIEKLNEDYTASTMENGGIIAEHMEAGSQFKHNGNYYLLTDYTCCFCNYGSGARVYMSDNPMSGYQLTGNINRYPGELQPLLTDGIERGTQYATLTQTDSDFESIQLLFDQTVDISEVTLHQFTGNRPENCGDVDNPRVHPEIGQPEFELFYWDKTTWKPIRISKTHLEASALRQTIKLEFETAKAYKLKITPKSNYGFNAVYLNEIEIENYKFKAFKTSPTIPQKPIIPAQQTYVMELQTKSGTVFIWMGDLWGSASDNRKGNDYQYWSAPLQFHPDGSIQPMQWTDEWEFQTKHSK